MGRNARRIARKQAAQGPTRAKTVETLKGLHASLKDFQEGMGAMEETRYALAHLIHDYGSMQRKLAIIEKMVESDPHLQLLWKTAEAQMPEEPEPEHECTDPECPHDGESKDAE